MEPSYDHLGATLFHLLLPMGKGWLFGKRGRGKELQLKNTLMAIGSQGKYSRKFDGLKMITTVPI